MSRPLKDHLETVGRLYETQYVYDKRKEVNQFLYAQSEMRYNKEKPDINNTSVSMLSKFEHWKPIYKRTKDIVDAKNSQLESMRQIQYDELKQKEEIEWQELQNQRIDRRYKDKKYDLLKWETTYDKRFQKYLKDKKKNIEDLSKRYNKPNQAVPNVNSKTARGTVERVEKRVDNELRSKELKIEKLRRDLTPSFRPRINKTSKKIIKRSASKSSRIRNGQLVTQYNTVDKFSSFIKNHSYEKDNIVGFLKDFNDKGAQLIHPNQNNGYDSKQVGNYETKVHTDGTHNSALYGTKTRQDEFKTFLDNYESNISKAILIEEKLNLDINDGVEEENNNLLDCQYNSNQIIIEMNKSAEFNELDSYHEEYRTISSGKEYLKPEELEDDLGSLKEHGITGIDQDTQEPQVIETSAAKITEYLQQL